jgi:hypothetical protein
VNRSGHGWLIPVIPATNWAEIGDHHLRPALGKMGNHIRKITIAKKRARGMAQVQFLPSKPEALSSNLVPNGKEKQKSMNIHT